MHALVARLSLGSVSYSELQPRQTPNTQQKGKMKPKANSVQPQEHLQSSPRTSLGGGMGTPGTVLGMALGGLCLKLGLGP